MRLSPENEHSVLRASVVLAHFMICNQTKFFPGERSYREKMIEQLEMEIHVFHSILDKETKICMGNKAECIFYDHLCQKNKAWNFENLIKFLEFSLEGHSHPFLKILWYVASFLLKGNNSEIFLSSVAEYCPEKSTYCGRSSRKKREATTEIEKYIESKQVLSRNKRLFDPSEMMRLFNKVVCSREIMDSLSEYWDTHYSRFSYSRVWIMRIEADIWCCIVHNLEKSY